MEKLVYKQLCQYFISNNILTTSQPGLRPNHSTVSAMLEITDKWFQKIGIGQLNGVVSGVVGGFQPFFGGVC